MTTPVARHSTDPVMDAALREDAAMLEAMGQDPGPTLDDLEDAVRAEDWFHDSDMGAR
ncbi:hypothetical protein KOAAANKH_02578 [Brevundimonas sp. NIBR10]|uniref:hypothetical protein n=1 Tax=Brevundimonas sp. NIBR10 TaxID=3015997 RepID=UPI0022F1D76A|nr:hypothetical protein [Brevundimonas sp. NIBR10]WGM47696.1 hypothetical protein KOAAANKH_02578 [Brevundimonas sp. NIBR10]